MEIAPSSYTLSPPSSSQSSITFYDFLDKMRNPASLDLVRSIKSPENDGKRAQDFFSTMEAAIMDHPLWVAATSEEVDCATEGLEKYVMTKLFSRTFAASPEDVKIDKEIFEKVQLLQTFLKPEHLDIPIILQNEASWLLAEKELQKINAFKSPREKLQCIMSCCRVINNLLLNASISERHVMGGADDFLPVLIYVTIKANPPQLHSNLKFIQLYRRQTKLVSEAAYNFTNLVSAKSFIVDLNAKSLSMNEIEFEQSMQAAKLANKESQVELSSLLNGMADISTGTGPGPSTRMDDVEINIRGTPNYPYMEAEAGELTVKDVERLLSMYKDVVTKYTTLSGVVRRIYMSSSAPSFPSIRGANSFMSSAEGEPAETNSSIDISKGE